MNLLFLTWDIDPVIFNIGSFELRYYSLCWILAFLSSILILKRIYIKEKIDLDLLGSLAVYIFLGVFIGARLGHCLFYDFEYYSAHPLEIVFPISKDAAGNYHFGYAGLASHGGIIGIIIAIFIYCKRKKTKVWDILDKLGLIGPLAGAFIRLGNFFNSEIIGNPTDLPWGVVFKRVDLLPRHPSQLYETFCYILIFFLVYYIYTKRRTSHKYGFIFGVTISLVFICRFFIEFTKIVQSSFEESLPLDMGQLLSIPFIIIGIIIVIARYRK